MKYKIIAFIVLIVSCSLFTACAPATVTTGNSEPSSTPIGSEQSSPSASFQSSPSTSAQSSPSAGTQGPASMSSESPSPDYVLDPISLLIGSWLNDELQLEMSFTSDGHYTAKNNGVSLGTVAYTAEETGSSTVTLKTDDISFDVVFTDENHLKCDGISYVRIFEDEMVNSDAALKKLLVGSWETTEGGFMVFDADGTLTVTAPDSMVTTASYSIEGLEETSMTMTVTDSDGTSNSLYVYFTDNDTLVFGEAVLSRVS